MVVNEYNPDWSVWFSELRDYLKKRLNQIISIQHVGSTSIPGMRAKPIIDIDIVVKDIESFLLTKKELENMGYTHKGDLGIPKRETFDRAINKKGEYILDKIKHHLYVCAVDCPELKRHLLFREYLRKHKIAKNDYIKIKNEIIAKLGNEDRAGYVEMKENEYKDFFLGVLIKAEKEIKNLSYD